MKTVSIGQEGGDARSELALKVEDRDLEILWDTVFKVAMPSKLSDDMKRALCNAAFSEYFNVLGGSRPDPERLAEAVVRKAKAASEI